jgi:hypothetical protein
MMKAVRTSETSVNFNEPARRYVPDGCHLQSPLLNFCEEGDGCSGFVKAANFLFGLVSYALWLPT